jgi:hypothetical protein
VDVGREAAFGGHSVDGKLGGAKKTLGVVEATLQEVLFEADSGVLLEGLGKMGGRKPSEAR